jgi:hypothetical protein
MHVLIPERLRRDPTLLLRAKENLARWRLTSSADAYRTLDEWEYLLNGDFDRLLSVLVQPTKRQRGFGSYLHSLVRNLFRRRNVRSLSESFSDAINWLSSLLLRPIFPVRQPYRFRTKDALEVIGTLLTRF